MVLSSGYYSTIQASTGGSTHLAQDPADHGRVILLNSSYFTTVKFRRDKASWLSVDDGLIGKHGNPEHLRVQIEGKKYRIWVEQRGKDQFGLIPTDESGEYSNRFLAVTGDSLSIVDEWTRENGSIWVVSSEWEGPAGL